jgi:DHA2 family multidrug resistance protein-like MFS transporter
MTTADTTTTSAGWREWAGLALLCLPTMLTTIDLNVMLLA